MAMSARLKILVVEDDAILRKLVASLFTSFADVHAVESGNQAITYLRSNSADIVFSDVCMPDGTGVELLEWTRTYLSSPPVVILVTGQSTLTNEEAVTKGAHSLVQKPFKVRDLISIARDLEQKLAG